MTDFDAEFEEFADRFRSEALHKIVDSTVFISIMPPDEKFDVKFALELGTAIMFNKPIIVAAFPGKPIPLGLRRVATKVIRADIDTEHGREHFAAELKKALESELGR